MVKHSFKKGDKVQWSAGQGTATGTVEEYITEAQTVKGKKISASQASPRYLVKNDRTESVTAHSPEALSKASSSKKSSPQEIDSGKSNSTGSSSTKKSDSAKSSESKSGKQATAEKSDAEKSDAKKFGSKKSEKPSSKKSGSKGSDQSSSGSSDSFESGDRVQWDSRQGEVEGVVEKKLTSKTKIKGYTAKASEDEPQYLVKSNRTGSEAAHKPDALKSID